MTFKSQTQPLCRYCGGKIRKWTKAVFLHIPDEHTVHKGYIDVEKLPQTKAECQQYTNAQITSVKRFKKYDAVTDTTTDRGIDQFSTWDGETYEDEFFCNGTHARDFAYMIARQTTYASRGYHEAIAPKKEVA